MRGVGKAIARGDGDIIEINLRHSDYQIYFREKARVNSRDMERLFEKLRQKGVNIPKIRGWFE